MKDIRAMINHLESQLKELYRKYDVERESFSKFVIQSNISAIEYKIIDLKEEHNLYTKNEMLYKELESLSTYCDILKFAKDHKDLFDYSYHKDIESDDLAMGDLQDIQSLMLDDIKDQIKEEHI